MSRKIPYLISRGAAEGNLPDETPTRTTEGVISVKETRDVFVEIDMTGAHLLEILARGGLKIPAGAKVEIAVKGEGRGRSPVLRIDPTGTATVRWAVRSTINDDG